MPPPYLGHLATPPRSEYFCYKFFRNFFYYENVFIGLNCLNQTLKGKTLGSLFKKAY